MFNKDRLRIAKELRGLSNADFANKLGCSISKIKQLLDVDKEINDNDQLEICHTLNLPMSFFMTNEISPHETDQIFYRSLARIKAQHRKTNEAYTLLALSINKYLMQKVKLPVFHRPDLDITEFLGQPNYAEHLASELRGLWALGNQPINNIISLCELKGIRVFRLPMKIKEIDALSFFDDESGCPFIFLNTFKSAERARFDCAHELGHIVMHTHNKKIRAEKKDNRVLETEANQFSSEFLMPTDGFFSTVPRYLSLENMIEYKKVWRTSLKAINYKAHKLNLISDWVNRSNAMKMNSLGFNINEPEETHRDESLMLPKIMSVLFSHPSFDKNKMLDEIGISEDDFNILTFDALLKVDPPRKKPKLYIVT
ncbi:Zn-dependent peptidase ImmA (M78 family) [Acinetobacter calcoaceticus]|uniref:Zn-dependent peptidase ImmA (M78 family) n=1 Tax=Acinetobacter calcoaceticus TaxID=471 RepID=A0A4V2R1H5_ACICA|nr:Zn-dependent peptidase ImmA (M78 family) [Acinetobacter calcoaceticus]